jgi:2-beta-glucuronyltransferase
MSNSPVAVLLTGHFYDQKRRGSIHWLADEFIRHGWEVRFVTVGYSCISRLIGDVRLKALGMRPKPGDQVVKARLSTHFRYTAFHPIDLRSGLMNRLASGMFGLWPRLLHTWLRPLVADAQLVVIESGLPLLLTSTISGITSARLVYRVNDDVRAMRTPPRVAAAELEFAPLFDRISLASPVLARRFQGLAPIGLDPMGLDKSAFDVTHPDPYAPRWEREVVCAGTSHFDAAAVIGMAKLRPSWRFHIIGRLREPIAASNIVARGEMPFAAIIPFVQHADYALAPYRDVAGMEYQAHHSNRLLQYAYARLPTAVPERMLHPDVKFLVGYQPGDDRSLDDVLTKLSLVPADAFSPEPPPWEALYQGVVSVLSEHDNAVRDSATHEAI